MASNPGRNGVEPEMYLPRAWLGLFTSWLPLATRASRIQLGLMDCPCLSRWSQKHINHKGSSFRTSEPAGPVLLYREWATFGHDPLDCSSSTRPWQRSFCCGAWRREVWPCFWQRALPSWTTLGLCLRKMSLWQSDDA